VSYRRFEITGDAEPSRVRTAALLDAGAATMVAMIAFPFPIVRALFPVAVFVASILVSIVVAHVLYCALTMRFAGRTPGMFFLDLGPVGGAPALGRALLWGLGASVSFWPTVLGMRTAFDPETGTCARISGIEIGSTQS